MIRKSGYRFSDKIMLPKSAGARARSRACQQIRFAKLARESAAGHRCREWRGRRRLLCRLGRRGLIRRRRGDALAYDLLGLGRRRGGIRRGPGFGGGSFAVGGLGGRRGRGSLLRLALELLQRSLAAGWRLQRLLGLRLAL